MHKFTAADMEQRFVMCRWFEKEIEEEPDDIWFSDKEHFSLCKHLNSDNGLYCTVAISKNGIIGPFWFKNANMEVFTVTKEHYIYVLNKFW